MCSRKLQVSDLNDKYKTELCRNWKSGYCPFDTNCAFAHGEEDLRARSPVLESPVPVQASTLCSDSLLSKSAKRRLPVFVDLASRKFSS